MNVLRRVLVGVTSLNVLLMGALFVQSQRAHGAKTEDLVRARAIELVDEHGQVRAQLNVEADSQVVFRLRDARGEVRVKLGADRGGSGLVLLNGSTEPAVHMLAKDNGTSLTLRNKDGEHRTFTP